MGALTRYVQHMSRTGPIREVQGEAEGVWLVDRPGAHQGELFLRLPHTDFVLVGTWEDVTDACHIAGGTAQTIIHVDTEIAEHQGEYRLKIVVASSGDGDEDAGTYVIVERRVTREQEPG